MNIEGGYQKLKSLVDSDIPLCSRALLLTENILKKGLVTEETNNAIISLSTVKVKLNNSEKKILSTLKENLEFSSQYLQSLASGIQKEEFNKPYIKHSVGRIQNLKSILEQYLEFGKISDKESTFKSDLLQVADYLMHSLNPNLDDLFEHFKYGNKNYIIFGKNGAGKTSLLRKITTDVITENIVIIPANRTVNVSDSYSFSRVFSYTFNQKLADKDSIRYLVDDMESEENKEYRQHDRESENIYTKFKTIFNQLGLERDVDIEKKEIRLCLPTKLGADKKYPLSQASDGERTVIYMILAVLLSPQHAYIFIDEPENHLNGSLMRKLFDLLETVRSDARFIYLTHKTDFIESRTNFQLIYLEKTDQPDNWKFKDISDYKDISLSVILDIEGSLDNIIFCEGTALSIDGKILNALYPDYTVRSSGSCVDVKRNTEAINLQSSLFRRHAIGIVDGDFQTEEEKDSLRGRRVQTLDYNEWESLLLDEDILSTINKRMGLADITSVKETIIDFIRDNQINILNDYLTKRYSAIISKNRITIDRANNIEAKIDAINAKNKDMIIDNFNHFSSLLKELIANNEYSSLIKLVPGKQLLATAARALRYREKQDYISAVLNEIHDNSSFKNTLLKKIALEEFYSNCFPCN